MKYLQVPLKCSTEAGGIRQHKMRQRHNKGFWSGLDPGGNLESQNRWQLFQSAGKPQIVMLMVMVRSMVIANGNCDGKLDGVAGSMSEFRKTAICYGKGNGNSDGGVDGNGNSDGDGNGNGKLDGVAGWMSECRETSWAGEL